ncbi:cyclic nucleotide-binding protein [Candidatus Koribacter versatilis Ellin345]|uniref:Cyclic nucleotide-binding protein n=1 Tax=Koribacter versatilis (strain Ellin345) TaxID=204669 RepID=Q1IPU5_KORVE|nr:cyclic nucleotide-binding domain-containing protein [Candidatus Koribacter versatilis]ABF41105.1 cyclic nucleotide-binding protein [Candidatus Koribacter versatilis Ellin345]
MFSTDQLSIPADVEGLVHISTNARERLAAAATFRTCKPGEVLYRAGEPANGVYIVCRGGVKVTHRDQNLNDFELACSTAILGVPGVMSGTVYQFSATVLVQSAVAFIPASDFVEFVAEHPEADGIGGYVTRKFRDRLTV